MPGSPMVPLRLLVPRSWKVALDDAAATQGLATAQLTRLILGGFLRNRLPAPGPGA